MYLPRAISVRGLARCPKVESHLPFRQPSVNACAKAGLLLKKPEGGLGRWHKRWFELQTGTGSHAILRYRDLQVLVSEPCSVGRYITPGVWWYLADSIGEGKSTTIKGAVD